MLLGEFSKREMTGMNDFVILDGAMGTMLQKKGLKMGEKPELMAFYDEAAVYDVHKMYVDCGSDIIYANTFGANRLKMAGKGKRVEEIIEKNVAVAKKAAGDNAKVALDIGPIGEMLEPNGKLTFEEAYDIFKEMVLAGVKAGCDMVVIETMTDLYEARAGLLAAKENSSLPVMVTMSFEKNGRTFSGCTPSACAVTLTGLGADAVGVNCSLGPEELYPIICEMGSYTHLPLVVKANAGLPDPKTGEYVIDAHAFAQSMEKYAAAGVKYVGGCCGTSPEFIKELKDRFLNLQYIKPENEKKSVVCSPSETVEIDTVRVIGERINPTGKKVLKEALKAGDMNYVLNTAVAQTQAGADILDVNVGVPGIDEKATMVRCIKEIQAVTSLPLQIDSTKPEVIEAGLRVYNGKAIVNSVNGEDEVLDTILPIVKKYGAAVVGLTLDEKGIPSLWQDRVKIAEKILKATEKYGIPKEDVFIDTLTLTVSTEQEKVFETLKALRYVKENLGLNTVLGVSNISFGLPKRDVVNTAFLTLALEYGLTLPIINPNDEAMMGAIYAYRALSGIDKGCTLYTEKMAVGEKQETKGVSEETIEGAILKGLKGECGRICKTLLQQKDELEIINEYLIPALDKAGEKYEKGVFFLPQLLNAAAAANAAFDEIKLSLKEKGQSDVKKGKILLATVKGDIHDIGKNIVKVILENYGYEVIDLGKDVPPEKIVESIKAENAVLVGLSALMTTTLKSMEDTIKLIKEAGLSCKIMCGGAVLTEEYALSIGADFYAKDAKQSADIAKMILG